MSSWQYVASSDNPADVLSRGLLPNDLINSDIWWHGPSYLKSHESQWPKSDFKSLGNDMPEQRVTCTAVTSSDVSVVNDLIEHFSSLNKTCRLLSYCLRAFKSNASKPSTHEVSSEEILRSLEVLCIAVQKQAFPTEYDSLSKGGTISVSSKLNCLSPFMRNEKLMRIGGRLENSALSYDACHPIILPRNHVLTKRIIEYEHTRNMHPGLQATMAAVRQRFWPLALRSGARKIISSCIKCFKAKPKFSEALMGCLPAPRVTVSRPFLHCGVDYAGPVTLREGKRRNARNHKAYIAVFVCLLLKQCIWS